MQPLEDKNLKSKIMKYVREFMLVIGLLLIVLVLSIVSPYFLTFRNIMNILCQISMVGVAAIGTTFVIISGGIDLSPGAIASLAGVLAVSFQSDSDGFGLPVVPAIIGALLVGAGCGVGNGVLITKGKLQPFIATFCMMSIARGASFVYTWATPLRGLKPLLRGLSHGNIGPLPTLPIVLLILFVFFGLILSRTRFGTNVYATGGNEEATWYSGINTDRVKIKVYMIAGLLSALSGIIIASRVNSGDPENGMGLELDAIAACVMGGTRLGGGKGVLYGTFIGAVLLGVINNGLNMLNVSPFFVPIVKAVVILIAVLAERARG